MPSAVFEELGDEAGLARALGIDGQLRFWAGEVTAAIEQLERAAGHARSAGDRVQEIQSLHYVLIAKVNGPTPVGPALEHAERMRESAQGDHGLDVVIMRCRARLEAMRGNFGIARELIAGATALTAELGMQATAAAVQFESGAIELLAGRPDAAELAVRPAVEDLQRMGDRGHLASVAPTLADVLFAQGRIEEAIPVVELIEQSAIEDDSDPQIAWRRLRAKLLAHQGDFEGAERLARAAVERGQRTEFLEACAHAFESLADVLCLAGRPGDAQIELGHAIRLHEQKGNVVAAANVRARREALS